MSVDDLLRAVKNSVSNFAQSNAGRVIGMEALRAGLQQLLPHLTQYIDNRIHDIYRWYRGNH